MKINHGSITNVKTGETEELIVQSNKPCSIIKLIAGGAAAIGGIMYVAWSSFRYGADEYERAEYETLKKAGVITSEEE